MVHQSLILCVSVSMCQAAEAVSLFNGKDFDGWVAYSRPLPDGTKTDPWRAWSIKYGVITCTGTPISALVSKAEFQNYRLRVDWKYPADALTRVKRPNSGVLIHVSGPDKIWPLSLELQLANNDAGDIWLQEDVDKKFPKLDVVKERHDPKQPRRFFRIGGIEKKLDKPLGEWNSMSVECKSGEVKLSINGVFANLASDGSLKSGKIGLQSEGVEIQFRNLTIEQLK